MQNKKKLGLSLNALDSCELAWGEKYLLKLAKPNIDSVYKIASRYNFSLPVAKVLQSRGFEDNERLQSYLFPSGEQEVAHASELKGAEAATERILQAISKGENILVFGDYDVDGITSTSLILSCLLPLGAKINYFLPDRKKDGYGLSSKVVKRAAQSGYNLIITVDNGITAHDPALVAAKSGIDLIITDHHRPHGGLPVACAIVNPNQDDCSYPYKHLAGVGVIFKIISLIYEKKGLQLPPKAYELLMLGTIADVMPLTGENRYWVRDGLSRVNKNQSYALNILMKNGNLNKNRINSLDIGFMIAPQLNALGRLSNSRDAVRFLISSKREDVEVVGRTLYEMNEARKFVERQIYDEIAMAIEHKKIDLEKENIIMASGSKWPAGVVGLVAGRLMNNYGRPSFIFHLLDDGTLKGSCRSIPEFNIFDALAENEDLLISFGGHSCAAGLALKQENLPELKLRLEEKIAKELTSYDLQQKIDLDAEAELSELNYQLVKDLENLEPFGSQNQQPTFFVKNVSLLQKPKLLKDKHIKCSLFSGGVIKQAIFFNRPELYEKLCNIKDKSFDVAGNISINEWSGKASVELIGVDVVLGD